MIIPLVVFKEGGLRIPLGKLMTYFLRHFKLCPDQSTLDIFRVVSSVAEQNKRLSLNLSEHDINQVYSCQDNSTSGYYFKFRHGEVRLVSCLPDSDKETQGDFLMIMGNQHPDELPYPISQRRACLQELGNSYFQKTVAIILVCVCVCVLLPSFAADSAFKKNKHLINAINLNILLRSPIYVHPNDQL